PNDAWAVGLCYCRRPYDALALHWNGASWTQATTPNLGMTSALASVSAVASNDVWAVGATGANNPLAIHWNGSTWNLTFTPNGSGSSGFYGVAVRSATDVYAVGYQNGLIRFQTFAEWYTPGPCATSTPTHTPVCTVSFSDVNPPDYFYTSV